MRSSTAGAEFSFSPHLRYDDSAIIHQTEMPIERHVPEATPTPPPGGEIPPEGYRQKFHRLKLELRNVYALLSPLPGAKHLTLDQVLGNAYQPEPFDAKNAELVFPDMERALALAQAELEELRNQTLH